MIGVLALQGDVREHLAAVTACGDMRAVPVRRAAELDAVHALVIPGGESTTMSRLLQTFELLEPLRARIAAGMPAYGSCAGMILLAREVLDGRPDQQQLGGLDVVVRRNAFGRQVDSFETDLRVAGAARGADARGVHPGALGRVGRAGGAGAGHRSAADAGRHDAGPAAGRVVAVRQGAVLATSFHPELTGDLRMHALFCDVVRESVIAGPGAAAAVGRRLGDLSGRAARPPSVTWPGSGQGEGEKAMSGHSKWATTKHKKAVIDARRGKMFAKLIKNIEVAARTGGGDPDGNPTLFDAIQKAKKSSVPNDNIDRAVKRGSGADAGGADYQTITYEGYGPNGVAVLIECLTDNRNRAATEVRMAMTRNGGRWPTRVRWPTCSPARAW